MNQTYFGMLLSQLLTQTPLLLVYFLGVILCAVWWRRAPTAAMLALAGCALLLLTTIGFAWVQNQMIQSRMSSGTTAQAYAQSLMWVSIGSSIFRAAGMGLLLAAVFAGRPRLAAEVRGGFEVQGMQPPPMPR